jgi:hypothetical protein
MAMDSNVVKFPYTACRRAHSRMPRRSKNGTPEERAAREAAAAAKCVPAAIVDLSEMLAEAPADRVDRRKLRSSPLREKVGPISFAVTVVGKMVTADIRDEPLDLAAAESEGWLQNLQAGAAAARFVADELDKAAERLTRTRGKSENSDLPVNLPVPDVGQPVLNLATGHDQ